jgi:thiol-disulfide isomerase/thioredoxin
MNKKRLLITGLILIVALSLVFKVLKPLGYKGNDAVILLPDTFSSLAKIKGLPIFKGKVLYIDIWGTSCPSCFHEFKNYTPQLTDRYKNNKDIAFLYICIDRYPLPELRWKEKIELFKPKGVHILVRGGTAEKRLSIEIFGTAVDDKYLPYQPCYLIINKEGEMVTKPNLNPELGERIPSETFTLYRKLDSLIALH